MADQNELLNSRVGRNLLVGRITVPLGTAARTDNGANGELGAYVTGATVVLQVYSQSLGAWVSVTLT